MSQQQPQVETDAPVSEEVLREQIDKCNEKVKEIIEDRIDVDDEDDIYRKIDGYLGNVERATLDCFTNRNQTSTLFDQMKWLLRALIEDEDTKINWCAMMALFRTTLLSWLTGSSFMRQLV